MFRTFDKDNDGLVSLKEWIEGLSVVLRGTLDERIKCKSESIRFQGELLPLGFFSLLCAIAPVDCFHVYDLNADKYITREEMLQMLRYSLRLPGEEDPYDGIKDLVEITLKRMVCILLNRKKGQKH